MYCTSKFLKNTVKTAVIEISKIASSIYNIYEILETIARNKSKKVLVC